MFSVVSFLQDVQPVPAAAPLPLRSVQVKESSPPPPQPSIQPGIPRAYVVHLSNGGCREFVGNARMGKFSQRTPKKAKSQKSQKKPNLPSVFSPFPPASTSSLLVLRLLLRLPCVDTMPPLPSEKNKKKNEPSCEPVSERARLAFKFPLSASRDSSCERLSPACAFVARFFRIFCVLCVACARARARVCLYFLARLRVT